MRRRLALPERGPWSLVGIAVTILFVSSSFALTGRDASEGLRLMAWLLFIDIG